MKIEFLQHLNKKDIHHLVIQLSGRLAEIEQKEREEYDKKYLGKSDKELASDDANERRKSLKALTNSLFSFDNGTSHLRTSIKHRSDV